MKLIKYSLLALAMAFSFSSCDDDNKYVEGAQSPGAFFPKNSPEIVELPQTGNSVDITIGRTSLDDPSTYTITATDESGLFTFPSTVTFGPQEHTTSITVTFDQDEIITDELYPASITVEGASTYGNSTYEFDFCRKAPLIITETEGLFYSDMWEGTPYDVPVEWCVSENDESKVTVYLYNVFANTASMDIDLGITNPDGTHPVYFNGPLPTGVSNGDGFELYWTTVKDFMLDLGKTEASIEAEYPLTKYGCNFNDQTGVISLYMTYSLPDKGEGYWYSPHEESIHLAGYPDYSVSVAYNGLFMSPSGDMNAIGLVSSGSDVKEVHVANVPTDNPSDVIEGIKEGTYEFQTVEGGVKDVEVKFPVTEAGTYTIVALSVDKNGKYQLDAYQTYQIKIGVEDPNKGWTSLGTGLFTDGINTAFFMQEYNPAAATWDVEIQEKDDEPGVYRVVDVFGNSPVAKYNGYDGIGYFVVDCTDPTYPLAGLQFVGWEDDWGKLSYANYEGYLQENNPGASKAAVQSTLLKNGFELSELKNGIITMPNPIYTFSIKYPNALYFEYPLIITLPSAVQSSPKKVAGSKEYFGTKHAIAAKSARRLPIEQRYIR